MTPLQTELSQALHALADEVAATRRTRARGEAPLASTNGFCGYLFACAFASLGDRDAAFAMRGRARSMLASVGHESREDVTTHAGLTTIFEARLDQAIDGAPYATPLPQAQRDIYVHTLSRLGRYKVDRLREASRLFDMRGTNAEPAFKDKNQALDDAEPAPLRGANDPETRAARVAALIESPRDVDDIALAACLDALPAFPEDQAMPMVVDILELAPHRNARLELFARALAVVVHFGFGELVPRISASLRSALSTTWPSEQVVRAVSPALRMFRHLGELDDLRALIDRLDASVAPNAVLSTRLAVAAARLGIGDERAAEPFRRELARAEGMMRHTDRLQLIREIANGYAHADAHTGVPGIRGLVTYLRQMTDTLGTNTHYCWSVLYFVDALVYGVIGLDVSRPGWEPRA